MKEQEIITGLKNGTIKITNTPSLYRKAKNIIDQIEDGDNNFEAEIIHGDKMIIFNLTINRESEYQEATYWDDRALIWQTDIISIDGKFQVGDDGDLDEEMELPELAAYIQNEWIIND